MPEKISYIINKLLLIPALVLPFGSVLGPAVLPIGN